MGANSSNKAEVERKPVSFKDWKEVLAGARLADETRADMQQAIFGFLRFCKGKCAPASIMLSKLYIAEREAQAGRRDERLRAGLRWFVTLGKVKSVAVGERKPELGSRKSEASTKVAPYGAIKSAAPARREDRAPRAADDLGGADWERDLIKAMRERGFLFRTEATYREWARKFAVFLGSRSPYAATGEDIGAFLSGLAVTQRSAPSTQKQALNALVFLMREALKRELGEIPFRRAWAKERVPTVLSREECARLFSQLEGTTRLMAELAYGAGLRLMELLRLRVHHLDLERHQLLVHSGKGDKDRVTVLPASLIKPLREHVERLRGLFAEDRASGLPGVWLPEGLARKYAKAGERWEWQWLFPSREASVDPMSGVRRRHHLSDNPFQTAIRNAAARAQIDKRVTPHVLRHSCDRAALRAPALVTLRFASGQALTQTAA
jgi:integron integrase